MQALFEHIGLKPQQISKLGDIGVEKISDLSQDKDLKALGLSDEEGLKLLSEKDLIHARTRSTILWMYLPLPTPTAEVLDTMAQFHWSFAVTSSGCFRLSILSAFGAYKIFDEHNKDTLNVLMRGCAYSNYKMHEMATRAYLAVPTQKTVGEIKISEVVEAMKVQEENPAATARICYGLMAMGEDPVNRAEIGSLGGIEQILKGMKVHNESEYIVGLASLALAELVVDNEENQERMLSAEAVEGLMAVMKQHSNSSYVQETVCVGLANFTKHSKKLEAKVMSSGALEGIIDAMSVYQGSVSLQMRAIGALSAIVKGGVENQDQVVAKGGVNALTTALRVHAKNSDLELEGCEVLELLVKGLGSKKVGLSDEGKALCPQSRLR